MFSLQPKKNLKNFSISFSSKLRRLCVLKNHFNDEERKKEKFHTTQGQQQKKEVEIKKRRGNKYPRTRRSLAIHNFPSHKIPTQFPVIIILL